MSKPDQIFMAVLKDAAPEKAVARLSHAELLALSGWLSRDYQENGPSGKVLGICLVEGFERFKARQEKRQAKAAKKAKRIF